MVYSLIAMSNAKASRREAGMSIVEIMIAMVVIALALLAMISLMTSSHRVQEDARERSVAYNAARAIIEDMRQRTFIEIFDAYKSGASLNRFTVDRVGPPPAGDTHQGRVEFPEKNGLLDESYVDTGLGMPKDLNQDGDTADLMSGTEVSILPVRVVIRWQVPGGGEKRLELASLITSKRQ